MNQCTAGNRLFFWLCACIFFSAPAYGFEVSRMELLQDRDYAPQLIQLISSARQSIKVCMFQAVFYPNQKNSPSNLILSALIEAHKRGVKVEVILDNGGSLGEVEKTNTEAARFLKNSGITVYFDSAAVTTHTKFLTIDTAIAVLGSTNWTYSALAKNHELSAVFYSQDAVRKMNEYFEMVRSQGERF